MEASLPFDLASLRIGPTRVKVTYPVGGAVSMTLVLASLALAFQSKPVTFDRPAATLTKLLPELGRTMGVPLEAATVVGSDVLLIRVSGAPRQGLLDRIAEAAHGTWKPNRQGLILTRDAAQHRKRVEEYVRGEVVKLRQSIAAQTPSASFDANGARDLLAKVRRQPNQSGMANYREHQRRMGQSPVGNLFKRLLPLIDLASVVTQESGRRVVFSSQPNRMQLPLGPGATQAIQAFQAEQRIWAEVLGKAGVSREEDWELNSTAVPGTGPGVRAILSLSSQGLRSSFDARVKVLDADGRTVASYNGSLTSGDMNEERFEKALGTPTADPPLKLSPDAQALLTFAEARRKGDPAVLDPKLKSRLLWPEKEDPLAFAATDLVSQAGANKRIGVVANVSDLLAMIGTSQMPPNMTPGKLLRIYSFLFDLQEDDDWLVVSSSVPVGEFATRLDREALGRAIRSADRVGRLDLDTVATFTLSNQGMLANQFMQDYVRSVIGQSRSEYWDVPTLRLYASLRPEQRKVASIAPGLPLVRLNPSQLELAARLAYDTESGLSMEPTQEAAADAQIMRSVAHGELQNEPTELAPNGLPAKGYLFMPESGGPAYFTVPHNNGQFTQPSQPLTAYDLAFRTIAKERPDLFPWADQPYYQNPVDRLLTGTRRLIEVSIRLTDLYVVKRSLAENVINEKPMALADLPKEFQDEVAKTLTNLREQYKNAKVGQVSGPKPVIPPR